MSSNLTAVDFSNTKVIDLGIGDFHTLALKENGTVKAWGENASGQINVPTNLKSVIAVAGGDSHSVALQEDGTVAAWGNNELGNLCSKWSRQCHQISVGHGRNMALRKNGTVSPGVKIFTAKGLFLLTFRMLFMCQQSFS